MFTTLMRRQGARLTATAATLVFLSLPAYAQSAQEVADRFMAIAKAHGATEARYETVSDTSDGALIEGIYVKSDGARRSETSITSILLTGPELSGDNDLKAEKVTIKGFSSTAKDGQIEVDTGVLEQVTLPGSKSKAEGEDSEDAFPAVYSAMTFSGIVLTREDNAKVPVASFSLENSDFIGTQPRQMMLAAEGIVLSVDNAPDDEARESLKALGYETITANIRGDFRWDDEASVLHINGIEFAAADVGTLRLSAQFGGITKEFVAGRQGKEAMELIQNVSINSLSINFENDSIVERALKMQASEQGTDPAALVDGLLAQLPGMLMILQNEGFAKKAEAAATAFLRDPKTLSISAKPAQPLPAAQIMGAAMMAPQSLIGMLNVDVAANK